MGAKSNCTLVQTKDLSLLIDPGAAPMQPSYPLPSDVLDYYKQLALESIWKAGKLVDQVVITHYHGDHYLTDPQFFKDKQVWIKDPNRWINLSQKERARGFLEGVAGEFETELIYRKPPDLTYKNPFDSLPVASSKEFGDYQERREELLDKWRDRFYRVMNSWQKKPWIDEGKLHFGAMDIKFADGKEFTIGDTKVRFTEPLFHGIEYAKTGWVVGTIVETKREKFIHSSDLQGPTIEDYARWIISEHPDYLILDGPATYLYGWMLNTTNLNRSLNNATRIAEGTNPKWIIYDHHLVREPRYRERAKEIFSYPEVHTAAQWVGKRPLIDRVSKWKENDQMEEIIHKAKREKLDREMVFNGDC